MVGSRNRVLCGFLADPTHVSLGLFSLVVATGFMLAATSAHVPLPAWLLYGWAFTLSLSGGGKIAVPYLYQSDRWAHLGREVMLSSAILASATWGTIAVGAIVLLPAGGVTVAQALALCLGATGRAFAAVRLGRVEEALISTAEREE